MRWFRRKQPREVNIDPVQLAVLHFILKKGPTPLSVLFAEVERGRILPRSMFETSMADLVEQGVATAGTLEETGEPVLIAAPLGKRLKSKLPRTSTSRITFYV